MADRPELDGFSTPLVYPWYAIRVKSNFEKTAAMHLRGKGFEEFLPLYKARNRWSDRSKTVELPLFSGYVFCRFDVTRRLPILMTPGVVYIVSRGKDPAPIDDEEIEAIQKIARAGTLAAPWPYLRVGRRVEIVHGALKGLNGILVAIKSEFRLIVSVTLLQRSVAAEVDRDSIRPIL